MSGLSATVRRLPEDVGVVFATVIIAHAAWQLGEGSPVRLAVALAFLLFVPGYALTTAVFPAKVPPDHRRHSHPLGPAPGAALDSIERAAVSFGLSLVLLPLFGLAMAVLSWGFTPRRILLITSMVAIAAMALGVFRRLGLPDDVRYDPPVLGRVGPGGGLVRGSGTGPVMNVVLTLAILTATGALAIAVVAPQDGEAYTDMTLLAPTEGGDLAAADYPTQYTQGQGQTLVLEVVNHEDRPVHYSVVVKLERVDGNRITQSDRLHQFEKELPAAGTWQIRHTVNPSMTGENLRLTYLLYEGEPPANPHVANAYRYVYLWIDVSG